jgi:hypothetical protein
MIQAQGGTALQAKAMMKPKTIETPQRRFALSG